MNTNTLNKLIRILVTAIVINPLSSCAKDFKLKNLSGKVVKNQFFNLEEVNSIEKIDFNKIKNEKVIGYKIPGYLSEKSRNLIRNNFLNSPYKYKRSDLDDHEYIGAYLARISLDTYFANTKKRNPHLSSIFHGTVNEMDLILERLRKHFASQGIVFRKAQYKDKEVAPYNLHNWIRNERSQKRQLSLVVHDDLSLAMDKRFESFEISQVKSTFAVNLSVENTNPNGGKLVFWNILPSIKEIKNNATIFEYGPYDSVDLSQFDYREVAINSGDLYVFNGQFLHAVTDLKNNNDMRLGFSLFCGYLDDKTIIYWE